MKDNDRYGVIIHPNRFEKFIKMTDEQRGKIVLNMIRVFQGEEPIIYDDQFVDYASDDVCERVLFDKELSERQRNNRLGKTKDNQTETKNNQKKPNDNQKEPTHNLKVKVKDKVKDNNSPTGNIKEMCKEKYGEFDNVLLTVDEFMKLKDRFPDYKERIERLSTYIEQFPDKAKKYKSHYATILSWAQKDEKEKKPEKKKHK